MLEDAGNWIDYLYKEYPYWERKDAIEITYDEYGAEILNIDDLALSLLPKSEQENIKAQRQSLAATFSHYPGYWKPAGEPAYLVRKQSRTRGDWAQEIFKIVTGNSYELLSYRERLDFSENSIQDINIRDIMNMNLNITRMRIKAILIYTICCRLMI